MKPGYVVNRKQFLSLGLAAAGMLGLSCGMGSKDGSVKEGAVIHVDGTLPNELPDIPPATIDFVLSGPRHALTGTGRSAFATPDPQAVIQSFSIWDCAGSVSGDVLTLNGTTSLASFQPLLGAPVNAEVNLKTGEATWSMGPFLSGRPKTNSRGRVTIGIGKTQITAVGTSSTQSGTPGRMP